jgi:5-methylthioadenosine/S-adenosylhomocysteine deaminase
VQRDVLERLSGTTAVDHLAQIGFLSDDVTLADGVRLTGRDVALCAERGSCVCHNPTSNLRLRNGIAPVHAMRDAGVPVALGTNSTSFADRDDFFDEMRMAYLLHRLPAPGLSPDDAPALRFAEVLEMATTSGARAVGLDGQIGELLPGRQADAVLLRREAIDGAYVHPATAAVDACLMRGGRHCVDTVLVGGDVVIDDGRCVGIDEDALAAELRGAVRLDDRMAAAWSDAAVALEPHVRAGHASWRLDRVAATYAVNSLR